MYITRYRRNYRINSIPARSFLLYIIFPIAFEFFSCAKGSCNFAEARVSRYSGYYGENHTYFEHPILYKEYVTISEFRQYILTYVARMENRRARFMTSLLSPP